MTGICFRSLSGNPIVSIDPFGFNGVSAYSLSITSNYLRHVYPYSFNSVALSLDFSLQYSLFTIIPEKMFNTFSCDELYLHSGNLELIEQSAFNDVRVRKL